MKLFEVYPLTIVGLRAWPNPTKGIAHSGIEQVDVKGPNDKIKLKAGKKKKPLFSKVKEDLQLDEGWHKHFKDGSYTAEMSDMKGLGRHPNCPKCKEPVNIDSLKKVYTKDADHELRYWEGVHACGAKLTVWND